MVYSIEAYSLYSLWGVDGAVIYRLFVAQLPPHCGLMRSQSASASALPPICTQADRPAVMEWNMAQ